MQRSSCASPEATTAVKSTICVQNGGMAFMADKAGVDLHARSYLKSQIYTSRDPVTLFRLLDMSGFK
jgi:hypothetical protein